MTQLPLAAPAHAGAPVALASRVAAWAREHTGAAFWQLTDALPDASAGDIDKAAREAGALGWLGGRYVVQRPERAEEEKR